MKKAFQDILYVLQSRILVLGSGLGVSIITARCLTPSDNGIIAAILAYAEVVVTIGSLGIGHASTYFIGKKKYTPEDIFHNIISIWLGIAIISVGSISLLLNYNLHTDSNIVILVTVSVYVAFNLLNNYCHGFFLGTGNIKQYSRVNWIPDFVKLIFSGAFLIAMNFGVFGALSALSLGQIVLSISLFFTLRRSFSIKIKFDRKIATDIIRLGLIYAISQVIINLNYRLSLILLEKYSTSYEVGIYSKGVSIVQYLWEIPTLLSAVIFSRSANASDSSHFSKQVCYLLRVCTPVILLGALTFYLISDQLMLTLYGERFAPSAGVQKILLPGIWLMTVFKILNMDLVGRGKPWLSMYSMIPGVMSNIALNWYLDTKYGATGAAFACTISYALISFLFLITYSRITGISIAQIYKYSKSDLDPLKQIFRAKFS